ncbi:hypothetical protein [Rhizobium viscosum]|uniref:Uncharacterized protein n=1 Tax=Rhizobium viscosum TaxID=1673 RepID=A0ABR9IUW6_RHIVS|nr:hypothetical protein [Rhizobium viscosum]MBE1506920.1 hypothetical protein [Rhizobium viscosum]
MDLSGAEIGSKANRRPRPDGDLKKQLERILKFMRRSCDLYDAGDEDEAIPLALEMRKLLYDRGSSKSLLGQLGFKEKMMFVDSALYPDRWRAVVEKMAEEKGMVATRSIVLSLSDVRPNSDGIAEFRAPLSEPHFYLGDPLSAACPVVQAFEGWWTTPVVEASSGRCFSRANLIMIIADQENGAHVDPELDGDFQDLCIDTLGIAARWTKHGPRHEDTFDVPDVTKSLPYSAVRQVAWEVLTSIERWQTTPAPGQFLLSSPFQRKLEVRWMQRQPMLFGSPVEPEEGTSDH